MPLIQPESGSSTIRDLLQASTNPESFTIGRIDCVVQAQGANAWTILRCLHDYYSEMVRRSPDRPEYWMDKVAQLEQTEARWRAAQKEASCNPA